MYCGKCGKHNPKDSKFCQSCGLEIKGVSTEQKVKHVTEKQQSGISQGAKTTITILSLIFIYPLGLVFMWTWMRWKAWIKIVLTLLVGVIVLPILLAITLIAINPAKQFSEANNTMRRSHVNMILNAVNQYMADNRGYLPAGITTTTQDISTAGADICAALVPTYITALPVDPLMNNGVAVSDCTITYDTAYKISVSPTGGIPKVTVIAPKAEINEIISISR